MLHFFFHENIDGCLFRAAFSSLAKLIGAGLFVEGPFLGTVTRGSEEHLRQVCIW